jgi:exopolysaccharide biosynthesis polyprenyl glycosylphosphotransferase
MTPQLAAKLTIHDAVTEELVPSGRRFVPSGSVVPLPVRRGRAAGGAERIRPSLLRREALHRRLLGAADMLAATLALTFVLALAGQAPTAVALAAIPLIIVLFKVGGLYDRDQLRLAHSTLDEVPSLLQLTGVYVLGALIVEPLVFASALSGGEMAGLWLATFIAILASRSVARWLVARAAPIERCLVIGDPERADRIRSKVASSHARASVVATLPLSESDGGEGESLASLDSVRLLVDTLRVDRVIIAPTTMDTTGVVELIRVAKVAGVRVSVLPRMLEVVGSAVEFDDVDGMTMLGVRPFGLPRSSHALKRAFDILVTSLGLLAVGPVIAAIAIAIKLDSRGPVFFRQTRVGRDGRHFSILKFRSMVVGADAQKDELRGQNEVSGGMFKISDDPRVTRVGKILRGTSLDELPQLFNVVRGEMSLVGPRPLVVEEDTLVVGLDRSRLHLTPGMTGPWQVLGSRVPMHEMVGIDYLYVAGWSLWVDLKLLFRTAQHVMRRGNV